MAEAKGISESPQPDAEVLRLTQERDGKKLLAESAELDTVKSLAENVDNRRLRVEVANAALELERAKLRLGARQLLPSTNEPWLAIGFALFGVVLGFATGLSKTSGAAQSLMTGIFAFVGGSLLSYTGFRRFSTDTGVEPRRVGQGLSGFSVGLIGGLVAGALLRVEPGEAKTVPARAPVAGAATPTASDVLKGAPSHGPTVPASSSAPPSAPPPPAPPAPCNAAPPPRVEDKKSTERRSFYLNSDPTAACSIVGPHQKNDPYDPSDAVTDARMLYQLVCSKQN